MDIRPMQDIRPRRQIRHGTLRGRNAVVSQAHHRLAITYRRNCHARVSTRFFNQNVAKLGSEDVIVKVKESEGSLKVVVQLFWFKDGYRDDDIWVDGFLDCALLAREC